MWRNGRKAGEARERMVRAPRNGFILRGEPNMDDTLARELDCMGNRFCESIQCTPTQCTILIIACIRQGVLIYDTNSDMQITQIDRPPDSPRADLFKCNLYWQDDTTLLIAWADIIKVARIRARPRPSSPSSNSKRPLPPLLVELTAMFAVDCMISGIVPYPTEQQPGHVKDGSSASAAVPSQPRLPSFLILAYHPPDTSYLEEATMDRTLQARKLAERPELQIISRAGQELSSDVLGISGYQTCGCNDYVLAAVPEEGGQGDRCYVVLNPKNVVLVRPRDRKDHIQWLVDRMRYEEALEQVALIDGEEGISVVEIGQRYIEHLIDEGKSHCYHLNVVIYPVLDR